MSATGELEELLARGELTVVGRIREASNAVLLCTVAYGGRSADCVYKPVKGERPLWDFPDGNLAQREVAAYLVSEATGWGLVPPTVLRDGPYGEGMVQLWIGPGDDGDDRDDGSGGDESGGDGSDGSGLLALVEGEEAGRAGSRSPSPTSGRAAPRCSCTPTTGGCAGLPCSTP